MFEADPREMREPPPRPVHPPAALRGVRARTVTSLRAAAQAGFTLIEMMIVTVVIMVVGGIAFAGLQMNAFESAFERFGDDLNGAFVQARNLAIAQQTTTELRIRSGSVELWWVDSQIVPTVSATYGQLVLVQTWDKTMYGGTRNASGGLLANDADACIMGVIRSVQVPSQVQDVTWPTTCMSSSVPIVLRFNSSGEMSMVGQDLAGAGVTLVFADRRDGTPSFTLVEAWPGGLVRKHMGVQ
jgi:prepilin-type N-terminal cleavage/methylation domain-containing protein